MHVVAAKAVIFGEAATPSFQEYAQQVIANASVLGEELSTAGLLALGHGGNGQSPSLGRCDCSRWPDGENSRASTRQSWDHLQ